VPCDEPISGENFSIGFDDGDGTSGFLCLLGVPSGFLDDPRFVSELGETYSTCTVFLFVSPDVFVVVDDGEVS